MVLPSLKKIYLYPILVTNVLNSLTTPFSTRYYHLSVILFLLWIFVVVVVVMLGVVVYFQSVKCPDGIFASL